MGEPKWTPGPWRWEMNKTAKKVELVGSAPRQFDNTVMTFVRWGLNGAAPAFWSWPHDGARFASAADVARADDLAVAVPGREHHARWFSDIDSPNAHLIAAAPDLYTALEIARTYVEQTADAECGSEEGVAARQDLARIDAAMAAARGEG